MWIGILYGPFGTSWVTSMCRDVAGWVLSVRWDSTARPPLVRSGTPPAKVAPQPAEAPLKCPSRTSRTSWGTFWEALLAAPVARRRPLQCLREVVGRRQCRWPESTSKHKPSSSLGPPSETVAPSKLLSTMNQTSTKRYLMSINYYQFQDITCRKLKLKIEKLIWETT